MERIAPDWSIKETVITMDDCVGIAVPQWRARKLSRPVMPGSP